MKESFEEYLASLDMAGPFRDRVREIYEFCESLYEEEIEAIFVDDLVEPNGRRIFRNLWLFGKEYLFEASNFASEDSVVGTVLREAVTRWELKKRNYSFDAQPTADSRLTITVHNAGTQYLTILKATGSNCSYLQDLFLEHIIPNVLLVNMDIFLASQDLLRRILQNLPE